ncbi:ABC transporter ATP-binding protein [Pelagibacterium lentulum]|uniref:Sugar ABC transporter ATP-binding protein n=1 Tax=Pelagibacterium lentulum TaxID=2029865 RepID=A0A916W1U6_9HYPH|nr:sn-glycerol-3-phosphate ABC transporter ATP-binding protein UgpC [Pelagibacterium lentulum]GGA59402.1 sugar ABC transporter ATP-binding protein [Pelagibacterium lentulum]
MADLALKSIHKSYGSVEVIKGIDLDIGHGEFVVFVGPSGCGKSTLLRMIAGLEEITSGELYIGEKLCNNMEPRDRGIAMVFQSYALYPHMSVYDNVGFGLKLAKAPKEERDRKIREAARILQMEHLLERRPSQLSGGQRQRVAIGRAIVREPEVFLFDEPLSNLDAALRVDMRMELSKLHQQLGATMIYVTHDQVEAMTLADKIVVLNNGEVQQTGAPIDLYKNPANLFVAGFIGSPKMNLSPVIAGEVSGSRIALGGEGLEQLSYAFDGHRQKPGDRLTLGIRPHALKISETGPVKGKVDLVERLGNETIINFRLGNGEQWLAVVDGDAPIGRGGAVAFSVAESDIMLFDENGENVRCLVSAVDGEI